MTPTPSRGERWLASGMQEHEPASEVTILSTPDPQDACVDVRYVGDGSERLLPRECFLCRLARHEPTLFFNIPSATWYCYQCGALVVRARDVGPDLLDRWLKHNLDCPLIPTRGPQAES